MNFTAQLCRKLAVLLHAGISLAEGAALLAQDSEGAEQALLLALEEKLQQGMGLAEALEEEQAFPSFALGLLRVGEASGRMEDALTALSGHYDRRERTARQIQNAVTYPAMILCLMALVIGVLLTEVLPVFDRVYASLGTGLTGFAYGLLMFGQGLKAALPVLLAMLLLGILAALLVWKRPALRGKVQGFYREKFADRGILRKFNNARFAEGLSMGLTSGLDLEQACGLARGLLEDIPGARIRCDACREALTSGADLAEALTAGELLPLAHARLLTAGIQGGNGDQAMAFIAQRLQQEAEEALERAVGRIEPTLVLVCSALVGAILLAVMLPLMGVLSALG